MSEFEIADPTEVLDDLTKQSVKKTFSEHQICIIHRYIVDSVYLINSLKNKTTFIV